MTMANRVHVSRWLAGACALLWTGVALAQAEKPPAAGDDDDARPGSVAGEPTDVLNEGDDSLGGPGAPRVRDNPDKWVKDIRDRYKKVQSIVARYDMTIHPRGIRKPLLENGVVKILFQGEGPALERWEGNGERDGGTVRVLRLVSEGKVRVWIGGKGQPAHDITDADHLSSALFQFPRLPARCESLYKIDRSTESDPWAMMEAGPGAGSFPTALSLNPRDRSSPSPRLKRLYLVLDPENGLVNRLRWYEMEGPYTWIDLNEIQLNAPVTPADFQPPAGLPEK